MRSPEGVSSEEDVCDTSRTTTTKYSANSVGAKSTPLLHSTGDEEEVLLVAADSDTALHAIMQESQESYKFCQQSIGIDFASVLCSFLVNDALRK